VITAGALVTSNDAGLSVPDWPTSFGYLVKVPHFVGGVRYAHATVAQTFFCIAVAIALFTGRQWVEDPADRPEKDRPGKDQPRVEFDSRHPSLFTLTLLSIVVLYVQLILGGMFRHHGMSWWPHVLNAATVSFVLAWTAIRAISVYSNIDAVRRPAIVMLSLLITQLYLGFAAFLTRVAWGQGAVQPELPMVASTVAHVAVGALLLATTVVLAIQVWRNVPAALAERVPQPQRDVSAA
jgi:cytochrome c oxidase assembly protein subunit 15